MAIFADVQYCIYADIVGWSGKAQQCADVIQEWSLSTDEYLFNEIKSFLNICI